MSNDLHKQVYNNLNLKETDELVEIWQKNNRVEWTEDTFNIIRDILQERLGELPPQDEPIWEYTDDDEDEDEDNEDEYQVDFLIDDENPPEFYNPHEVLRLEKWLHKAAIASIIASVFSSLLGLKQMQQIVLSFFIVNGSGWDLVAWLIAIVIFVFAVGLQSIIIYFPLKALGSILKILMEMEFNSRGVTKTKNA
jgi:hypothetical protein